MEQVKFEVFAQAVNAQFNMMAQHELFVMDVDKDELWNLYLDGFPAGTNEIYKERREYDCNCCSHFVKRIGNIAAIIDGKIVTVWDTPIGYPFTHVSIVMAALVRNAKIRTVFYHDEEKVSAKTTRQTIIPPVASAPIGIIDWNHFWCEIPSKFVTQDRAAKQGQINTVAEVFKRGLTEVTRDALLTTLDLINSKSIYKGDEFFKVVSKFSAHHAMYSAPKPDQNRDMYIWANVRDSVATFRNTVIGTLVTDLSDGVDLETAVAKYESKVAPQNYKRSSALITKGMIDQTMETVDKLGLRDSIERRHATVSDVSVNDIIYVDRNVESLMRDSLVDSLMAEAATTTPVLTKDVTPISIEAFINEIVSGSSKVEVMITNAQVPNLMSITAPVQDPFEKVGSSLFKWDNDFAWSYNGEVTDSIKQRVKTAGGNIEAKLRVSLSWDNYDDLDIHMVEPNGVHIYHGNKRGKLDVDMNVSKDTRNAVENIAINDIQTSGEYRVYVENYTKRESIDVGFTIEVEFNGVVRQYHSKKSPGQSRRIEVMKMRFENERYQNGQRMDIKVSEHVDEESASTNVWGIDTHKFHRVSTLMLSPNYWNGSAVGNKHWFFILEGCLNPERTRGIYNEFLNSELTKHRKVFEVLADKTKCEVSDDQLSGVGFSSTKRTTFTARVDNRVYEVSV